MTGIRLPRRADSRAEVRQGRAGAPRVRLHPLHPATARGSSARRVEVQARRLRRTSAALCLAGLAVGAAALLPVTPVFPPVAVVALVTPVAPAALPPVTIARTAPAGDRLLDEAITPARTSTARTSTARTSTARTSTARTSTARTSTARTARPRTAPKPLTPQAFAVVLETRLGWGAGEQSCLVALWTRESLWNSSAANPSTGAYGIPQALPGDRMASVAADWATNPMTQVRWGVGYIASRYGDPCTANQHSLYQGWY